MTEGEKERRDPGAAERSCLGIPVSVYCPKSVQNDWYVIPIEGGPSNQKDIEERVEV